MGDQARPKQPRSNSKEATDGAQELRSSGSAVSHIHPIQIDLVTERFPIAVWTTDKDLLLTSGFGRGLAQWSDMHLEGMSIQQLFQTQDPEFPPIKAHRRALQGEEVEYRASLGGRDFSAHVQPLRDLAGNINGVIGVALDITGQTQAERNLETAEKRSRDIVENASDMFYVQDLEGNFKWVNRAACRITGYSFDEAIRLNMTDVVAPEDWEAAKSRTASKVKGEIDFSDPYEVTLITKSQQRVRVEVATRLTHEGGVLYIQGIARDITERRRAEDALRIQKAYLEELIESAPEAIVILDNRNNVLRLNREFTRVFQYTNEESVGRNIHELIIPHGFETEGERLCQEISLGMTIEAETVRCRKDRTTVDVSVIGRPIIVNEQQIATFVIYRDITEQKQARLELQRSDERFRAVIEDATDVICMLDRDANIQYASPSSERRLGYAQNEIQGKWAISLVHEDDQLKLRQLFEKVWNGASLPPLEVRVRTRQGTHRYFEVQATPPAKTRSFMVTSFRDVSERREAEQALRESEERYRLLFERNLAGVYRSTVDGKFLDCNDSFARCYGYQSREEVLRVSPTEFYTSQAARDEFIQQLRSKKRLEGYESKGRRRDGSEIWTLENISLIPGRDGNPDIIEGTMLDITTRKQTEEALRESERRLRQRNTILIELSKEMSVAGGDLQTALRRITEAAAGALEVDRVSVWLFNEAHDSIRCIDVYQVEAGIHHEGESVQVRDYPGYFEALEQKRTVAASNVYEDFRTSSVTDDYFKKWNIISLLDSPIRTGGKVIGLISHEVCGTQQRQWMKEDEQFSSSMGDLVALAFEESERRVAQQALSESENKFRAVADTASSAIYIHDNHRFLYHNRASEQISGYTASELDGMAPFDVVHPEYLTLLRDRATRRLRGEEVPPTCECKVIRKDGEERWVELSATGIQFESKSAVLVTLFDITERKRATSLQAALYRIAEVANSVTRLEELYPAIHAIVAELMYAKNFYIALHEAGSDTVDFVYFVDEVDDTPPGPVPFGDGLTSYVIRTSQVLQIDADNYEKFLRDTGIVPVGPPPVDWLGVPLMQGNTTIGVLVVQSYDPATRYSHRDRELLNFVSQHVATAIQRKQSDDALRESEARNRSLVQSAIFGIYRSRDEKYFLDINPSLVMMLGYEKPAQLLALDLHNDVYVNPEEHSELLNDLRAKQRVENAEVRWKKKDGRTITVRLSGRVVSQGDDGMQVEMIAEDVTERRALEEQLRQSQKMEAVGRLAGGVAHDFNNLLTVIKGYSELLLGQLGAGDPLNREVEEIRKAADRAAALTQQLLAFSRKQVLAPKVIDLNSIIGSLDRLLRRLLGEDVTLATMLAPSLGRTKADPSQIEQVIMNLAVNARDAMPHGGKLTIETMNVDLDQMISSEFAIAPGPYVMIAVSDTGTGMEEATRARVFEPFFTTKEQGKGTGLGLSTVYGIVKQSGGYIWVYSEVGIGTTFKVYLPRVPDDVRSEAVKVEPEKARRGTETILLVEDEDGVRALVRQILERQGYRVLETRDGGEALIQCERFAGPIHLLLSDVVLAQMNGRELAQRLLRIRPDMQVLFMSGYSEEAIEQHGVVVQGTHFIQKPFVTDALVRKVRDLLDASRQRMASIQ